MSRPVVALLTFVITVAVLGLLGGAIALVQHLCEFRPPLPFVTFSVVGRVNHVAFSRDSKTILVANQGKFEAGDWVSEIHAFDIGTQQELHSKRIGEPIGGFELSSDGSKLFVVATPQRNPKGRAELIVFAYPSFEEIARMDLGEAAANVHVSPDGQSLAVSRQNSNDQGQVWETWILDSVSLKKKTVISDLRAMSDFQFTPDSKFLVACHYLRVKPGVYDNRVLDVIDVETGAVRKRHKKWGPSDFQHSNGRLLMLIGGPSYATYESPDEYVIHKNPPYSEGAGWGGFFSPDGRHRLFLLSAGTDRRPNFTLSLQDVDNARMQKIYHEPKAKAECSAFSPDSKRFAVGTSAILTRVPPNEAIPPAMGRAYVFTILDDN